MNAAKKAAVARGDPQRVPKRHCQVPGGAASRQDGEQHAQGGEGAVAPTRWRRNFSEDSALHREQSRRVRASTVGASPSAEAKRSRQCTG